MSAFAPAIKVGGGVLYAATAGTVCAAVQLCGEMQARCRSGALLLHTPRGASAVVCADVAAFQQNPPLHPIPIIHRAPVSCSGRFHHQQQQQQRRSTARSTAAALGRWFCHRSNSNSSMLLHRSTKQRPKQQHKHKHRRPSSSVHSWLGIWHLPTGSVANSNCAQTAGGWVGGWVGCVGWVGWLAVCAGWN